MHRDWVKWGYCSSADNFTFSTSRFNPSRPFIKTAETDREGDWEEEEAHPDVLYIYIYTPIPLVAVSLCCSLPAGVKAQQLGSIRSLSVWLCSSQQGYSQCRVTQNTQAHHYVTSQRRNTHTGFYILWNSDKERRELQHCVCCNDTPPPVRLYVWRESQW